MPTTTRAGSPPTAYRGGLQPVGPRDLKELHRRASRTDLDFESALRSEGTVVLKEGLDVNTLGVEHSPSASPSASSHHHTPLSTPTISAAHRTNKQPSTPTVVPPTPASAPVAGPSSPKLPTSSPISSQMHDPFYDTDDADRTVNRRSMYRSPGTASSPDLATLLRKAKEKGGTGMMGIHGRDKRRESPPPLPPLTDRTSQGLTSPRYPTSPQPSPLPRGKAKSQRMQQSNSSEWVLAGLQNGSPTKVSGPYPYPIFVSQDLYNSNQPTKSSVRSKASTFLGKMLGQNTVRERSVSVLFVDVPCLRL
jgi:PH and SEC7 domain-containing protein